MVSTYFKNLVADVVWHTQANASLPDKYYLALSSTEPLENGTGLTEPSPATGYQRVEMTGLMEAVDGVTKNETVLVWPEAVQEGGAMTHWALFDAASGGNLLMGGQLDSTKHLDIGTSVAIKAEKLELRVLGA